MSFDNAIPIRSATAFRKSNSKASESQEVRDMPNAAEGVTARPSLVESGSSMISPHDAATGGCPRPKVNFNPQPVDSVADMARQRVPKSRQLQLDNQALSDTRKSPEARKEVTMTTLPPQREIAAISARDDPNERPVQQKTRIQPQRAAKSQKQDIPRQHCQSKPKIKDKWEDGQERVVSRQKRTTSAPGPSKKRKEKDTKDERDRVKKQQKSLQEYIGNIHKKFQDPQQRIANFRKDMAPLLKIPETDPFYDL